MAALIVSIVLFCRDYDTNLLLILNAIDKVEQHFGRNSISNNIDEVLYIIKEKILKKKTQRNQ